MSNQVKLILYVLLTVGAGVFGYLAGKNYRQLDGSLRDETPLEAPALPGSAPGKSDNGFGGVVTYGILFVTCAVALGLLIGHDVSQALGNKAVKALYNDEGEGMRTPEYEQAEQEWADGHHLEAIRRMREVLLQNPGEVHVALRIAEIYEKDLHNPLAAALEYEEVLQHNLPPDRWGWSAIHLCNLYFKLGHTDKAVALLRRIDAEYGETPAAEKARKRLEMFEKESGEAESAEAAPEDPGRS